MNIRQIIQIIEAATSKSASFPTTVYHGTTDIRWQSMKADTLFLTSSRDDAANYAEEALQGDYANLGLDFDDPAPSTD